MRFACILILMIGYCSVNATSKSTVDSLLRLANTTHDSHQKILAYRNLADIYFEAPEEKIYLKKIVSEAQKLNDKETMLNSLSELTFAFIRDEQEDSISFYMDVIRKASIKKEENRFLSYLRMRIFDNKIQTLDAEETIKKFSSDIDKNKDIYTQIEHAYITGIGLKVFNKTKAAIPYLETAYKLSLNLPDNEKYDYQRLSLSALANSYAISQMHQQCIVSEEKLIQLQKDNYEKYYKGKRPYFDLNSRLIQAYAFLSTQFGNMPRKNANYYLSQILEFSKHATGLFDKYNIHFALSNYYTWERDFPKAISCNDSLIKYAQSIAPYNLPNLHKVQSELYENTKNYHHALHHYKIYNHLKDSMTTAESFDKLNELQVKYDVDKLNYENTRLEIKNKKIILTCLSLILIITVALCAYLYYNLKKEKRLKAILNKLYAKAEESEKMKTVFINSMCHEIRTPLNAIAGFSEVIADDSFDQESKQEFSELIKSNADLLTTLINHLLEVANLDSSDEKLTCETTNINDICRQEMKKLRRKSKEGIEYLLEIPQEDILISTNTQYLSLVIENLLDNANKFTEAGNIALGFHIEKEKNKLQLYVSDTGCGIPADKHEIVFERFAKIDTFSQGNGLGLYLAHLIVKRLSGEIYIDPNYTEGTCILIDLPI